MTFKKIFPAGCKSLTSLFLLATLQACAGGPVDYADRVASKAELQPENVSAEPFTLTTYSRITDINAPVTIYIEGDTRGWLPTVDPGADPTPDDFLGLRLATLDPSPNVVYIARPCQFAAEDDIACSPETWSRGRYAELIVSSMNRAVDHFAVPFTHPQINLVGYSGGGAIAAVIASRRHDVTSLRTIAGNLDPEGASRYHAADLDEDFVDPMHAAPRLNLIPQEHYVGDKDAAVPPFLTANFIKAVGPGFCVHMVHIEGVTHKTGWEQVWHSRAAVIPSCGGMETWELKIGPTAP